MSNVPSPDLQASQARARNRRLVTDRGPDAGRLTDHLKRRSLGDAAARLLGLAEQASLSVPAAGLLTGFSGNQTVVHFVSDWSQSDGEDVTT